MLSRSLFGFMLPGLILAAGCTARPEPEQRPPPTTVARTLPPRVYPTPPSKEETAATGIRQVTLHVPEMTARLRLT
jgi:hypothetical protein